MAQFPCPTSPPCASVGRSRQSAVDGMSGGYLHRVNNVMHAASMWGTNHAPGKVDNVQLELVALFPILSSFVLHATTTVNAVYAPHVDFDMLA